MSQSKHQPHTCGTVYLVGAGPGDTGLLTRAGADAIACADAIVFDRLANSALLQLAQPTAELIDVGKYPQQHKYTQEAISQILVDLAQQGKTVCRLKGGDPFVFGRGGEEATTLREHHIPFIVIPGVSSAIAVPAYAGIPVTDRRYAGSFAVITGHDSAAHQTIGTQHAFTADTLVFLMGLSTLPHIVEQLIAGGRSVSTPIAVIQDGTTPRQRAVTGTLATIVTQVQDADLHSPVTIVVGEVVHLRESLAWFDQLPLFSKRILITRAQQQADSLASLLKAAGAEPVVVPLIAIEPLPTPDHFIPRLQQADWLVFTSSNGASALLRHLSDLGYDLRAMGTAQIAAIGSGTAQSLQHLNLRVDFQPKQADAAALAVELPVTQQQRIVIVSPLERHDTLVQLLHERGVQVDSIPVYRTVPVRQVALPDMATLDAIIFASPSAVCSFRALVPGDIGSVTVACLGIKTAIAARNAGLTVHVVSSEMSMNALVDALKQYYTEGNTV